MLGDITRATEIWVICGTTDMRKSIDGLCGIIRDQLSMEPENSRALYMFCGRRRDRIKVLLHENDGELSQGWCLQPFQQPERAGREGHRDRKEELAVLRYS